MKTRKQKVIFRIFCTIVSIFLLASLFLISTPVSADTLYQATFRNFIYVNDDYTPFWSFPLRSNTGFSQINNYSANSTYGASYTSAQLVSGPAVEYTFDLQSNNDGFLVYYFGSSSFNVTDDHQFSTNDTALINGGTFRMRIDSTQTLITGIRFTLRKVISDIHGTFGPVVAVGEELNFTIGPTPGVLAVSYPTHLLNFVDVYNGSELCLCVEFEISAYSPTDKIVTFWNNPIIVSYGSGISPDYPIFPSSPGGDLIDGSASLDQEILDSSSEGLDTGLSVIGGVGSDISALDSTFELTTFSARLITILDRLVTLPGLDRLVNISLALGLFASLMALSASIISAADRKAGQAKREASRNAKRDKKK